MTRKRNDNHSTEFGLWLRGQLPTQVSDVSSIDSSRGFVASNVDFIWSDYKSGWWILIEEKRYGCAIKSWQRELFQKLDDVCRNDPFYCGFYFISFERTNPDDGHITINGRLSTKQDLLDLLTFKILKEAQK